MSAAFGGRLGWGDRPALLLVDVVRAYTTRGSPLDLGEATGADVVAACVRLRDAARAGGVPVLLTVVRYASGAADAGLFVQKVPALRIFAADAPDGLGEVVPELDPGPEDLVVVKQYASAFAGTSLAATLRAYGVDTVVVTGFSTSGCVRATATDAIAGGFRPMVVGAACGDRRPAVHEANLSDLDAKSADVVTEADAVEHLRAGWP